MMKLLDMAITYSPMHIAKNSSIQAKIEVKALGSSAEV